MDSPKIQCQVCSHSPGSHRSFLCPTCARNALYEPRIQHALVLIEKGKASDEVNSTLAASGNIYGKSISSSNAMATDEASSNRIAYESARSQQVESREKTTLIYDHVKVLREQTQSMRQEIAKRQLAMKSRRLKLDTMKEDFVREELKVEEPFQQDTPKLQLQGEILHTRTSDARVFLCREVAKLYGLQKKKRKKGVPGRDAYYLGGVSIVDLRDINNTKYTHINVCLGRVAHFTHLISHYLALRLPAEIVLPSTACAHPLILSPVSSYTTPAIPSVVRKSSTTSSSTNALPSRHRPLHLERNLSALVTEDPITYAQFVDAVTLLAWDIAWLCKTQGIDVGARSWEDICPMGRNLWNLLVSNPSSAAPSSGQAMARTPSAQEVELDKPWNPSPGHFSHGTHHSFLTSAEGTEFMRTWKLASPVRMIEKMKEALASERMGAEWQVLEEEEWAGEGTEAGAAVVEGESGTVNGNAVGGIVRRVTGLALGRDDRELTSGGDTDRERDKDKDKGKNGWMRVRGRGDT